MAIPAVPSTAASSPRRRRGPRAGVSRSPAWTLAAVPLVSLALAALFVSPWMPREALTALRDASGGWVQPTLVAAGLAGLVQLTLLFGPGGQRPGDVGWRPRLLLPAAFAGLVLWLLMQAPALLALREGATLRLAPAWQAGIGHALGPLLAQLAATALVEETVFRGWLWPQLSARLSAHVMPGAATLLAAVLSQAVFALLHLPMLLGGEGPVAGTIVLLFVTGLVFVAVYAATGNLFVAVAVHALGNAPTLLASPSHAGPAPTMILLAGTLVLVGACAVRGWRRRGDAGPPRAMA